MKIEHAHSLEQRDYWTANSIQNTVLAFLDEIGNGGIADEMTAKCRSRMLRLFTELAEKAASRNKWNDADCDIAVAGGHNGGDVKKRIATQRQGLVCSLQQTM